MSLINRYEEVSSFFCGRVIYYRTVSVNQKLPYSVRYVQFLYRLCKYVILDDSSHHCKSLSLCVLECSCNVNNPVTRGFGYDGIVDEPFLTVLYDSLKIAAFSYVGALPKVGICKSVRSRNHDVVEFLAPEVGVVKKPFTCGSYITCFHYVCSDVNLKVLVIALDYFLEGSVNGIDPAYIVCSAFFLGISLCNSRKN